MIAEINIIRLFLYNEEFRQKVHCYLSADLFSNTYISELFNLINSYYSKHSKMPVDNIKMLIYNNILKQEKDVIEEKIRIVDVDPEYYADMKINEYLEQMEEWIKTQNLFCFLQKGINVWEKKINNPKENIDFLGLQEELKEKSSVNFQSLDMIDLSDCKMMFDLHNFNEIQLKFNNNLLNKITNGGCTIPSLNLIAGPPNSGKTRFLCTIAADYLMAGEDVIYISLEMSEKKLAKLIDYMLIEQTKNTISGMTFEKYKEIKEKSLKHQGRLLVKQLPKIHTGHIRSILNDLEIKGFLPKIVIVDYLGLMFAESKTEQKTYEVVKRASEELRGLAIEKQLITWSGAQINRSGAAKKEGANMEDMAESYGLNFTSDLIIMAVDKEDMQRQNKQLFKIIKDREGMKGYYLFAEIPEGKYAVNFIEMTNNYNTIDKEQTECDVKDINKKFKNNSEINNNNKYKIGI